MIIPALLERKKWLCEEQQYDDCLKGLKDTSAKFMKCFQYKKTSYFANQLLYQAKQLLGIMI